MAKYIDVEVVLFNFSSPTKKYLQNSIIEWLCLDQLTLNTVLAKSKCDIRLLKYFQYQLPGEFPDVLCTLHEPDSNSNVDLSLSLSPRSFFAPVGVQWRKLHSNRCFTQVISFNVQQDEGIRMPDKQVSRTIFWFKLFLKLIIQTKTLPMSWHVTIIRIPLYATIYYNNNYISTISTINNLKSIKKH